MATELGEPRPKAHGAPYSPYRWLTGAEISLPPAPGDLFINLTRIVHERQSRRSFAPLPLPELGHLLSLSCRANSWTDSPFGFEQQFRGVPSAGAIHPVHVLVQRQRGDTWEKYDPVGHKLQRIGGTEVLATAARAFADELVASGAATLMALVAEPGKTEAKYDYPDSLVWRDAGVVIGAMSWAAEALGLNFCPLGATGSPYIKPLGPKGTFIGVGMLLLGSRPTDTV